MLVQISDEVRAALDCGGPGVALESTIIAHGFPRPDNLAVGFELEAAVRAAGATPATIALFDGRVRVGLDRPALERLAAGEVAKCSLRDIAALTAAGAAGATTVAATLRIAAAAGIAVFATGGIGGVHRGAGGATDVSADLAELARSRVAVVSAGAKSILDLAATLEVLETHGVPVIGFGTDEFPAFLSQTSGLRLRHRVDTVTALARIVRAQRDLDLPAGLLICQPPPAAQAMAAAEVEDLVDRAVAEAAEAGIAGAALTPYLLAAMDRLSAGRTRRVNRALAIANAQLAAALAVELSN